MRIEEITVKELRKATDEEIKHLRSRCVQVHRFMSGTGKDVVGALSKRELMTKYTFVREEMLKRGQAIVKRAEIDEEIGPRMFQKNLMKFDVEGLTDYVLAEKYVSLSGGFVKAPRDAKDIDVVIRTPFTKRDEMTEYLVAEAIKNETGKAVNVRCMPGGPLEIHLPIYDLVLRSRGPKSKVVRKAGVIPEIILPVPSIDEALRKAVREKYEGWVCDHSDEEVIYEGGSNDWGQLYAVGFTFNKSTNEVTLSGKPEKVKRVIRYEREGVGSVLKSEEEPLEKIETTENYHHIPVRGKVKGHGIVTITIGGESKGIKALEDTDDKEILTYMFDVDKWTLAEAKTWVAEHKKKYAFFKITKANKAKQIVGGLVYEPDVVDTQGEFTTEEEIEKAMYGFMQRYADDNKRIKVMHKGEAKSFPILECFQAEEDTKKGGQPLKKGSWWITVQVKDDAVWKDIEEEKLTGFSMGGRASAAK